MSQSCASVQRDDVTKKAPGRLDTLSSTSACKDCMYSDTLQTDTHWHQVTNLLVCVFGAGVVRDVCVRIFAFVCSYIASDRQYILVLSVLVKTSRNWVCSNGKRALLSPCAPQSGNPPTQQLHR